MLRNGPRKAVERRRRSLALLKNKNITINLKRKLFNSCVLPVTTYGMETAFLTINSANKP